MPKHVDSFTFDSIKTFVIERVDSSDGGANKE